jgi:hypothetical protein
MPRVASLHAVCAMVGLVGCGPSVAATGSDDGATTTSTHGSSSSATLAGDTTTLDVGTTSTSIGSTTDDGADIEGSSGTPPDLPQCHEAWCNGTLNACNDGEDNDGDGTVDLFDPECTSICDGDEASYHVPEYGNPDCKLDCFFDDNSGQGDDQCIHDLKCDEESPGVNIGCSYSRTNCPEEPAPPSEQCLSACEPLVPPGCDCFGCCTFTTVDGPVDLFLQSHPDCRHDNLGACLPCTSVIDECGNPCTPDACEICIGESAPPKGCLTNTCDNGNACTTHDDCACEEVCHLGCCLPLEVD